MNRRDEILAGMTAHLRRGTDQLFFWVLIVQWLFAIGLAIAIAPYSYDGGTRTLHFHVLLAVVFGGLMNTLPIALIYLRPGWWVTRHVVAITQMMWSALLVTITNGRIETHFHIFGSLGLLALYRDWKILPTATGMVAADHLIRGVFWPDSIYGISDPQWWVFLEHAGWVVFMDITLIVTIVRATGEMRDAALREARLERTKAFIEVKVEQRTLELEESSERYRKLVENTEAIAFEYDTKLDRVLYIAPQATRLLDCTLDELEDQRFLGNRLHPDDRGHVRAELVARAAGEKLWSDPIDSRLVTRFGRVVHIRTFLTVREGSRRVRAIAFDITRQRMLELELQQAQKLESVGRLAAGVAHEINTPIQFIGDSVTFMSTSLTDAIAVLAKQQAVVDKVLAADPADAVALAARDAAAVADLEYILAEVPPAAARALDGVERVSTIVRSMKVFAHPDADEMTAVDLGAAITSTLTISRSEYRYIADVETELAELPPVYCYAGEINQALLNIIVNAAHAIEDVHAATGARGRIAVRARVDHDHVEISIEDSGAGIPDHVRERIFDPFFTTKAVGKGTGQGLAIARSVIVDRHGGTLRFDTVAGAGTTFFIRLPIDARDTRRVAA